MEVAGEIEIWLDASRDGRLKSDGVLAPKHGLLAVGACGLAMSMVGYVWETGPSCGNVA